MSNPKQPDTEELVNKARQGDSLASQQLLTRHRGRLRKMVAVRMSDRLQARIDPSDVVQEALTIAAQRLPDYLRQPNLPFYPWLRNLAWQRLVDLHRFHVGSRKRSVSREEPLPISENSGVQFARCLCSSSTGPAKRLIRLEVVAQIQRALQQLAEGDRDILLLRHLEQLTLVECAASLEISETAAKKRYLRALERLQRLVGDLLSEI